MPKVNKQRRALHAMVNDPTLFVALVSVPLPATEEACHAAVAPLIKQSSLALTRVPLRTWRRFVRRYVISTHSGAEPLVMETLAEELGVAKTTLYAMRAVLGMLPPYAIAEIREAMVTPPTPSPYA